MNPKIPKLSFSVVNVFTQLVNPSTQLVKIIIKLKRYLIGIFPTTLLLHYSSFPHILSFINKIKEKLKNIFQILLLFINWKGTSIFFNLVLLCCTPLMNLVRELIPDTLQLQPYKLVNIFQCHSVGWHILVYHIYFCTSKLPRC